MASQEQRLKAVEVRASEIAAELMLARPYAVHYREVLERVVEHLSREFPDVTFAELRKAARPKVREMMGQKG